MRNDKSAYQTWSGAAAVFWANDRATGEFRFEPELKHYYTIRFRIMHASPMLCPITD